MGANTDPQSMRAAVDQLEAAKRSRSERAGANERREAKPAPGGPSGGGSDDWLGNFYRDNNIGGRGGSLDNEARDYWTKEAETRGKDAVMDSIRGTAQDQGTWGGPREPMPSIPSDPEPPRKGWPNKPPFFEGPLPGPDRPMPGKPPRDTTEIYLPGRPPGGRGDVRIQPFPFPDGDIAKPLPWFPPRGDDQIGPDGRPIGDDQPIRGDDQYGPGKPFPGFPGFPGRPPGEGSLPGRPPGKPPRDVMPPKDDYFDRERFEKMFPGRPAPGRPPVEKHPWGREDDPDYGRKKDVWHQKRRDEDRRRMEFKKELMKRRGGIDFGPGRGGRVDRDATRKQIEAGTDAPVSGGEFISPEEGLKGQEYMAFMERLLRQKQGQFDR